MSRLTLTPLFTAALCGAFSTWPALAQPTPLPRCTTPQHAQFDFWIGVWTVRWANADGTRGEGTNRIRRSHDGCVIVEEFDGRPGTPLIGTSLSVLDSTSQRWRQTWVDNTGAYLTFEGSRGPDPSGHDTMTLSRRAVVRGTPVMQRMVFRDIGVDSLTWDWQTSTDDGATWRTTWHIRYARRAQ